MNKLKTILHELKMKEANKELLITSIEGCPEKELMDLPYGLIKDYFIDIFVAPIEETYLPNELNSFMDGLVSVKPDTRECFSLWRDFEIKNTPLGKYVFRLKNGYLYFKEKIGQKRAGRDITRAVIFSNFEGEEDLEKLINETIPKTMAGDNINLYRNINLRVYPNIKIAKEKFGGSEIGAEMTQSHLRDFVSDIKPIYQLFESINKECENHSGFEKTIMNNIGEISSLKLC